MPEQLAKRANEADLRALYDLHKLWLKSPDLVERFLASGEAIIRSTVKKLGEAVVNRSHMDGMSSDSTQTMAPAEADSGSDVSEVVTPAPKQQSPSHVVVRVKARSGRLVLPKTVKVLFDGEDSFVTVRTEQLTN